jgi:hypothetical protein
MTFDARLAPPRLGVDWVVSSINGEPFADGKSRDDPFDSLDDVPALNEGEVVAVERGSALQSQLDQVEDITVLPYGSGGLPFVYCDEELPDENWSVASGQSDTYVQTQSPDPSLANLGAHMFRVWEDGTELTQQTSVSDVESTPGSYYVDEGADPVSIYVHPTGSTDPSSDGKLYEWNRRAQAVSVMGGTEVNDATIRGIIARRPLENNGAITGNAGVSVQECMVVDGGKHHFIDGGGGIWKDVIVYGSSPNRGITSAIGIVAFHNNSTPGEPYDLTYENILHVNAPNTQGLNTRSHGGFNPPQVYGAVGIDSINLLNLHGSGVVRGAYVNEGTPLGDLANGTLKYSMLDHLNKTGRSSNKKEPAFEDSVVLETQIKRQTESTGQTVTVKNCVVIQSRSSRRVFADFKDNNPTIDFQKCLIVSFRTNPVDHNDMISVTGDDCILFAGDLGTEVRVDTTDGKSLSQLQTDKSAFGNSVWVSNDQWPSLLGDWRKGDVRLNSDADVTKADGTVLTGELPDGTPITDLGPQKHWSWADREAKDGPPTQWPTPPTTKSECKTYVSDPTSWDWQGTPRDHQREIQVSERDLSYWKMDGASGEAEPDEAGGNDLDQQSGPVSAGNNGDFNFRAFDGSQSLLRGPFTNETVVGAAKTPLRFWVVIPLRIDTFGSNNGVYTRYNTRGWELDLASPDKIRIRMEIDGSGEITATVPVQTNVWKIAQAWYDPVTAEVGVRWGSNEGISSTGYHSIVDTGSDNLQFANGDDAGQLDCAIGPTFHAAVAPSKTDRDWADSITAPRTLSEIQNRTVTVRDI